MSSTQQLLLGEGAGGGIPNYIEEVFSCFLYTGTGASQTITNNIDLSTKGGLVWFKSRSGAYNHALIDTARGGGQVLSSNTTSAQADYSPQGISAFNTNGFTFGTTTAELNNSSNTYVSWTFRKQPKFFDVVTYTGNGTTQNIAHNLGSTPGCIIVKEASAAGNDWQVYHRSTTNVCGRLFLDLTNAENATNRQNTWGDNTNPVPPTSTVFTVGNTGGVNNSGNTYVAYLFAHDAGGFGLTGTDNVISCGTFTTPSTSTSINLGYEPQWLLVKATSTTDDWIIGDNMRGFLGGSPTGVNSPTTLKPNTSGSEGSVGQFLYLEPTGFNVQSGVFSVGTRFIYIAIRRGPMKVPTSGTDVFQPVKFISTASQQTVGSLTAVDMFFGRRMASIKDWGMSPRLTALFLKPNLTDVEDSFVTGYASNQKFDLQNGSSFTTAGSGDEFVTYNLRRSPSYMDVVCYTGNGGSNTITHNLAVAPELIIFKSRSATENWVVFTDFGPVYFRRTFLDLTNTAPQFGYGGSLLDSAPTATTISLLAGTGTNSNTATYLAYLFATCAGVSKVGTYTGTGTTLQINCGFTAGARFVLIKRADSTGDWYVWDSARGIVAGNDPYLLLNSTAAEVTSTDYVDTYSAGFEISSTAPAAINANSGTFIFLAIA